MKGVLSSLITNIRGGVGAGIGLRKRAHISCFTESIASSTSLVFAGINAWSVNGMDINSPDIASNLFQISLIPYLVMLFFLGNPTTKAPKLANFGFQFLLVFVFATIPAGIYAKSHYHDILANVDYLHGAAESLLTITNLLIISGFRSARQHLTTFHASKPKLADLVPAAVIIALAALLAAAHYLIPTLSAHAEPSNALSLPTWMVHSSSILEWLIAMQLIWEHAEVSNNPRWKGMTWAMVPAHASGLCACVFHLFYNSPALYLLVNLQAALTVLSNTAMAAAAYRIYRYESGETKALNISVGNSNNKDQSVGKNGMPFGIDLFVKSTAVAALVKYGSPFVDFTTHPTEILALSLVMLGTSVNALKWVTRST